MISYNNCGLIIEKKYIMVHDKNNNVTRTNMIFLVIYQVKVKIWYIIIIIDNGTCLVYNNKVIINFLSWYFIIDLRETLLLLNVSINIYYYSFFVIIKKIYRKTWFSYEKLAIYWFSFNTWHNNSIIQKLKSFINSWQLIHSWNT